jgi:hypothetical protein
MPRVEFKTIISAFERTKTFCALDRMAIVVGKFLNYKDKITIFP